MDQMGDKPFAFTLGMMIMGTAGVMSLGRQAGPATWIPLLLSILLSFPLYFCYFRVVNAYPGLGLFEILIRQFGAFFGRLPILLIVLYAGVRGALALRHFGEFVYVTTLHKTPQIVFLLCLGLLCALGARVRIEALGRIGTFLCLLTAASALLAFAANLPNMDWRHLLPIRPALPHIAADTADILSFPFGDAFLLLVLFDQIGAGQGGYRKFALGLSLGGALLLTAQLHNLLTLGALVTDEYFPFFPAMSLIDLGNFFQRIEALASGTLLFGCFFKGTLCVMVMAKGLAVLFPGGRPERFVWASALACVLYAARMFASTMQMFEQAALYKLSGLPLQVGLMLVVWIVSEIHRRLESGQQSNPNASATG